MRIFRWGFILLQCLWLNVVVPGHTRGAMAMPGSKSVGAAAVASEGCCAAKHAKSDSDKPGKPDKPLDLGRCAVCHYAIGLTLPPVFSFDHQPGGLIGSAPVIVAEEAPRVLIALSTSERGPPGV